MKDYFPDSVQMSELAVKHITDEEAEALMHPAYRGEQFSEPLNTIQFNEKKSVQHAIHGHDEPLDDPSEHTYSKGIHTIRSGFFYRHGGSSASHASKVSDALNKAGIKHTVLDHGEENKPFRGGANTKGSSHWWAQVKVHKSE